eukprot:3887310-Rhodomonas_salina.2
MPKKSERAPMGHMYLLPPSLAPSFLTQLLPSCAPLLPCLSAQRGSPKPCDLEAPKPTAELAYAPRRLSISTSAGGREGRVRSEGSPAGSGKGMEKARGLAELEDITYE